MSAQAAMRLVICRAVLATLRMLILQPAWAASPPTTNWAYYQNRAVVTAKIEDLTPWWKRAMWWWTKFANAWPFTAEWLSAAFDYNVAPFFQSFIEVRVERSANRVRLIPYGVHGQLTWADIAHADRLRASGAGDRAPAEWVVRMTPAAAAR